MKNTFHFVDHVEPTLIFFSINNVDVKIDDRDDNDDDDDDVVTALQKKPDTLI